MTNSTNKPDKSELRTRTLKTREGMSAGEVTTRSEKVTKNFIENFPTALFKTIQTIAIYYPIRNEVETTPLFIHFKKNKKHVLYPRTEKKDLHFHQVPERYELKTGNFGIAEPNPDVHPYTEKPDLIIVPGVCFSKRGDRIGYGAGYYDRFLAKNPSITTVGLCFDFQLAEAWDKDSHDHPIQMICTESQFIVSKTE